MLARKSLFLTSAVWLSTNCFHTASCSKTTSPPSSSTTISTSTTLLQKYDTLILYSKFPSLKVAELDGITYLIKDTVDYNSKLHKLKLGGIKSLNIVSDFDFTLSKFFRTDGSRGYSCHKVMEDCALLPQSYQREASMLQNRYYPLEISTTITQTERVEYMVEWVDKAHNLLLSAGLLKGYVRDTSVIASIEGNLKLREGTVALIKLLEKHDIPLLIFSAGLADVLENIIMHEMNIPDLPKNMYVISNRFIFDNNENDDLRKLIGFEEPVLHVFNKQARHFKDKSAFFHRKDIDNRNNLILLGDSLGDLAMSDGINHSSQGLLRIGFLNDRPERLESYLDCFDVVILGDPSIHIPLSIIEEIVK